MAAIIETTPLNIEAVNLDDECKVDAFHEAWMDASRNCVVRCEAGGWAAERLVRSAKKNPRVRALNRE